MRVFAVLCMTLGLTLVACGNDEGDGDDGGSGADVADATPVKEPLGSDVPYGNCDGTPQRPDLAACADGLTCIPLLDDQGDTQWCAPGCDPANRGRDCPAAESGSALLVCEELDTGFNGCSRSCRNSDECGDGQVCRSGRCGWER